MDEMHGPKTGWASLTEAMETAQEQVLGFDPKNNKNTFVVDQT